MTSLEHRARIHAALADPVRLGIVDELALSDRSPTELGERFAVRSNLLAHHLDVLEDAGVIDRSVSHGDRRRRYVRLRPDGLADALDAPTLPAAGVVFVCTHNAARSQLAAGLWNAVSPVAASSAGTDPAGRVHPQAVRAGHRRSIDLDGAEPRALDLGGLGRRLVVTVCDLAHEGLGALSEASASSGLPLLHWSIPDPIEAGTRAAFDAVTDELALRVERLAPFVEAS